MTDQPSPTRPLHPPVTPLAEIAGWLGVASYGDARVSGITLDSRRVEPGDLYAALPGARMHGAQFAGDAFAAGAVAMLTDPHGASLASSSGLPVIVVDDPRAVLGAVAAGIYGNPARRLRTIGVTGTQGKTTTTRLLDGALGVAGTRSAVIGTVGTRIAGSDLKTSLTTPEAPDLHGLFARMVELEVEACAMEVSSHALVLGRVDGVVFDVAVFLNLGRDHLDFHTDVEDYYQAKASLFTPERARMALVNVDDEHGRRLAAEVASTMPVRTFSVDGPADWTTAGAELGAAGSTFAVHGPDGIAVPTGVAIPGAFNISNALAAVAAAAEAGFDPAVVARGLAATPGVPGRLEKVDAGQRFTVLVDYAHKPDAVAAVMSTLRPVTAGRLVVVIGAGGDRDKGKRPVMGELAAASADLVIVTDDNPRTEDPAAIRAEVLAGTHDGRAEVVEIGDRREAIRAALAGAGPQDVVVIAGKGHESGQEVDGVVHPFDDREVARELLQELA